MSTSGSGWVLRRHHSVGRHLDAVTVPSNVTESPPGPRMLLRLFEIRELAEHRRLLAGVSA